MKFLLSIALSAAALLGTSAFADDDMNCSYSFNSKFKSDIVTVNLTVEGKAYAHSCGLYSKGDNGAGGKYWYYQCFSHQNENVVSYLAVDVSEGNWINAYKDASLLGEDRETVLTVCKKK